jgi:hypothetical protein
MPNEFIGNMQSPKFCVNKPPTLGTGSTVKITVYGTVVVKEQTTLARQNTVYLLSMN